MDGISIVSFEERYAKDFLSLNFEWLERYFYVEPHDHYVLSNPKEAIIDLGGYIFFALKEQQVLGTVALIKEKECYELSKMAVSPAYRGLKIGEKLLQYCIEFSKNQGWEKIMLYSNRRLAPAIHLYTKLGFKEVALEKEVHYERADIKMVLSF